MLGCWRNPPVRPPKFVFVYQSVQVTKPLFLVAVIFLLTVGIYANLYMFRLFEPKIILASCMLPYFG